MKMNKYQIALNEIASAVLDVYADGHSQPRTAQECYCNSFETLQELIDKTDVFKEDEKDTIAKQTFYELGYWQEFNGSNEISYHKSFGTFVAQIIFDLKYQRISFIHFDDPDVMGLDELNAVFKQADELGWLKV